MPVGTHLQAVRSSPNHKGIIRWAQSLDLNLGPLSSVKPKNLGGSHGAKSIYLAPK